MTPQDWLMEILALTGLVAMFVYVIYYYPKLSGTIPAHFDALGNPEGSENRNVIWLIPGISLFLYIMLPQILHFRLALRSSTFLNRVRTQKQFNGRVRLLRFQKVVLIWGLFYLSASTIKLSLHPGTGIAVWFFPVFLGLLIIPSLSYLIFLKNNP
jgi:uncharacterized membrane protein